MLSPRENLLNMYNHRPTEYVPSTFLDQKGFGVFDPIEKGDPAKGGYDGFGVRWVTPRSAGGAPIPAPNEVVLTDILPGPGQRGLGGACPGGDGPLQPGGEGL